MQTRVQMAGVRFCSPALQVEGEVPGAAVAGEGFTAGLLVSNLTPLLQQVSVAVGDASGFVMSGVSHRGLCSSCLQWPVVRGGGAALDRAVGYRALLVSPHPGYCPKLLQACYDARRQVYQVWRSPSGQGGWLCASIHLMLRPQGRYSAPTWVREMTATCCMHR